MSSNEPVQVFSPNAGLVVVMKAILMTPGVLVATGAVTWGLHFRYADQIAAMPDNIGWASMAAAAAMLVAIPFGIWLTWVYIKWNVIEYRIYEHQFEEERGVFNKSYRSAAWSETTDVQKNRSFLERVLGVMGIGVADLDVSTAGEDGTAISMRYVKRPTRAYSDISTYIEEN